MFDADFFFILILISDFKFTVLFEITYIYLIISELHPFSCYQSDRQTVGRQSSVACDAFTYEEHSDSITRHLQNRSALLQFSEINSFVV